MVVLILVKDMLDASPERSPDGVDLVPVDHLQLPVADLVTVLSIACGC